MQPRQLAVQIVGDLSSRIGRGREPKWVVLPVPPIERIQTLHPPAINHRRAPDHHPIELRSSPAVVGPRIFDPRNAPAVARVPIGVHRLACTDRKEGGIPEVCLLSDTFIMVAAEGDRREDLYLT